MSDSVWPHRRQPTRDSPGKNTGVGCHFLLQCIKVKSESEVTQPCPTRRNPMDCCLPGSSVHGIFQARVLEWGAIAFSHVLLVELKFSRTPKQKVIALSLCLFQKSYFSGGSRLSHEKRDSIRQLSNKVNSFLWSAAKAQCDIKCLLEERN